MSDERIMRFVRVRTHGAITDEEQEIFRDGLVNSLFVLDLLTFVETTYNLELDTSDLTLENFASVASIGRFISSQSGKRRSKRD